MLTLHSGQAPALWALDSAVGTGTFLHCTRWFPSVAEQQGQMPIVTTPTVDGVVVRLLGRIDMKIKNNHNKI